MKKFFFLLLAGLFSLGNIVLAEDARALFTHTFNATTNSVGCSVYDQTWTNTCNGNTITLVGFSNYNNGWEFVKCGRKKNASVATITTTQLSNPITKIVLTVDKTNNDIVNTTKVLVSDNANFTSPTEVPFTLAQGDVEIAIPTPTANKFYRIVFDCIADPQGQTNGPHPNQ